MWSYLMCLLTGYSLAQQSALEQHSIDGSQQINEDGSGSGDPSIAPTPEVSAWSNSSWSSWSACMGMDGGTCGNGYSKRERNVCNGTTNNDELSVCGNPPGHIINCFKPCPGPCKIMNEVFLDNFTITNNQGASTNFVAKVSFQDQLHLVSLSSIEPVQGGGSQELWWSYSQDGFTYSDPMLIKISPSNAGGNGGGDLWKDSYVFASHFQFNMTAKRHISEVIISARNCSLYSYGEFSPGGCQKETCGSNGTITSTRNCSHPKQNSSYCYGNAVEYDDCEYLPCYNYTSWSPWSRCQSKDALSCWGNQSRSRSCFADTPSMLVNNSLCESLGDFNETGICKFGICYNYSDFGPWKPACGLNVSLPSGDYCKGNVSVRFRACLADGNATYTNGTNVDERICERKYNLGRVFDILNVTEWSPWTECNGTCGIGERTRWRSCALNNKTTTTLSICGVLNETEDCDVGVPCYEYGSWSYVDCNASCGAGVRFETRRCFEGGLETNLTVCNSLGPWRKTFLCYAAGSQCTAEVVKLQAVDDPCGIWDVNGSQVDLHCVGDGVEITVLPAVLSVSQADEVFLVVNGSFLSFGSDALSLQSDVAYENRSMVAFIRHGIARQTWYFESVLSPGSYIGWHNGVWNPSNIKMPFTNIFVQYSDWEQWGTCNEVCGGGIRFRNRNCSLAGGLVNGSMCARFGQSYESMPCNPDPCIGWSSWSSWGDCDQKCNGGKSSRKRECLMRSGSSCDGEGFQRQDCNTNPCAVNGSWTEWSSWTSCSVSCGRGVHERFRTCTNPSPSFGGSTCLGSASDTRGCDAEPCSGLYVANESCLPFCNAMNMMCRPNYEEYYSLFNEGESISPYHCPAQASLGNLTLNSTLCGEFLGKVPARRCENSSADPASSRICFCMRKGDVGYGEWHLWSECTKVTCLSGVRSRFRECLAPSGCTGPLSDTQACDPYCPIHGNWGDWLPWEECSHTCGGKGERCRKRFCNNPTPMFKGRACYGQNKTCERCGLAICPVDGGWAEWEEWSFCDKPCGGGRQVRHRHCSNPKPAFGGKPCYGNGTSYNDCNDHACKADAKVDVKLVFTEEKYHSFYQELGSVPAEKLKQKILENIRKMYEQMPNTGGLIVKDIILHSLENGDD